MSYKNIYKYIQKAVICFYVFLACMGNSVVAFAVTPWVETSGRLLQDSSETVSPYSEVSSSSSSSEDEATLDWAATYANWVENSSSDEVGPSSSSSSTNEQIVLEVSPQSISSATVSDGRPDPTMLEYDVGQLKGESIDPRSLSISMESVDLLLPGNGGLDIVVGRSYNQSAFAYRELGNWALAIPNIQIPISPSNYSYSAYTLFGSPWSALQGQIFDYGAQGICDGAPSLLYHNYAFLPGEQINSFSPNFSAPWVLDIPGQGAKTLMERDATSTSGDYPDSALYVTADNWYAECIPPSQSSESWGHGASFFAFPDGSYAPAYFNGKWGGFRVISPEGLIYTFDMVYSVVPAESNLGTAGGTFHMTPSKVEDAHGNYLIYEYDHYKHTGVTLEVELERIVAFDKDDVPDGRAVEFQHIEDGSVIPFPSVLHERHGAHLPIKRVFVADPIQAGQQNQNDLREVNYEFINGGWDYILKKATLPEGHVWKYDVLGSDGLITLSPLSTFHFPLSLITSVDLPTGGNIRYDYQLGDAYNPTRLAKRTVTGADVQTGIWQYSYALSGHKETTMVIGPSGKEQYEFYEGQGTFIAQSTKAYYEGWNYGAPLDGGYAMGRLRSQRSYSSNNTLLRESSFSWDRREKIGRFAYGYQNTAAFESEVYGYVYGAFNVVGIWNTEPLTQVQQTVIDHQTGSTFTKSTSIADFNIYGQPATVAETGVDGSTGSMVNNISQYQYFNQLSPWIIGPVENELIVGEGSIARAYTTKGQLEEENRFGILTNYEYHPSGDLWKTKWLKDGNALESVFTNYKRGQAQLEQHPEGVTISRTIYDSGMVATETDGRNNTTAFEYDGLNRLTRVDFPGTRVLDYTIDYDSADPKHITALQGGYKSQYWADSFGRTIKTKTEDTTGPGSSIYQVKTYDAAGRVATESVPSSSEAAAAGTGVQYAYDALGRITRKTNLDTGHFVDYCFADSCMSGSDYGSNLINGFAVTNERGYQSVYEYRSFGSPANQDLMKTSRQVRKSGESGGTHFIDTLMTRDGLGLLLSATQGGITRSYDYNNEKLLATRNDPEAEEISFFYDEVGNLRRSEQGDRVISYSHDGRNRLNQKDYSDATPSVTYGYFATDQVQFVNNGVVRWDYDYSETGRIRSEDADINGQGFSIDYLYDANDALESATYPSGQTVSYGPDAYGFPQQVGAYVSNVDYHPGGQVARIDFANGVSTESPLEAAQVIDRIAITKNASTLLKLDYGYDESFNVDSIIHSGSVPGSNRSMVYDGLNRLIDADGHWAGSGQMAYDDVGNILSKDVGSNLAYTYKPVNNLLESVGSKTFAYDDFGNVKSNSVHNFIYNADNQAVSVPSLPGTTYAYDGNGKRALVTRNDDLIYSGFSLSGQLMFKTNATLGEASEYYYLGSQLVARRDFDVTASGVADVDGDQMPDYFEALQGTDPAVYDKDEDYDLDGLSNYEEFLAGTSPTNDDTDGDGMTDGFELQYGFDPLDSSDASENSDDDLWTNLEEFAAGTNPLLTDTDGDGIQDDQDPNPLVNAAASIIPVIINLIMED